MNTKIEEIIATINEEVKTFHIYMELNELEAAITQAKIIQKLAIGLEYSTKIIKHTQEHGNN